MSGASLLSVSHITKRFDRGREIFGRRKPPVQAVTDVSFRLVQGETIALVGESGSGKSTLGRVAIRLLEPSSGDVWYDGQNISQLRGNALRSIRRHMQPVFQDPYASLNPRMSIGATIAEGMKLHGLAKGSELNDRVSAFLRQVGLNPDMARRRPRALSGGQRQRVAIARALAVQPRILVADEPVSALDVSIQAEIIDLIRSLRDQTQLAMLFISHDLSVVRVIADRIMVLYLGYVVEEGDIGDVFAAPAHPYTAALLDAMPSHPAMPKRERKTLQGEMPNPIDPPSGCVFHPRCRYTQPECKHAHMNLRSVGRNRVTACIRDDLKL